MQVFNFNKSKCYKDKLVIKSIGNIPGPIHELDKKGAKFDQNEGGWVIDKHRELEFQKYLSTIDIREGSSVGA